MIRGNISAGVLDGFGFFFDRFTPAPKGSDEGSGLVFENNTAHSTYKEMAIRSITRRRAEVHCVAGGLQFGYEKSYADVIQRGLDLARLRHLPKSLIETASITVKILERNQPVTASSTC